MFFFLNYYVFEYVDSLDVDLMISYVWKGSTDGTVRVWEVETGRCLRIWEFSEAVQCVAWNPLHELPILVISV